MGSSGSSSDGGIGEALRSAKPDDEVLPRRFGAYVLLSLLGTGGIGAVYLAYEEDLHREVAIKLLRGRGGESPNTSRLLREAQALATLDHPNVVNVFAVGEVDSQAYVAMQRVEGRTLRAWQGQRPLPGWRSCVEKYLQAGRGLAAAHEAGLVHRDFKPDNCMVDDTDRVRVLDFGLVRRGGGEEDEAHDDDGVLDVLLRVRTKPEQAVALEQSLTKTGTVLGTPAYMPPEQMEGNEADARSDQFSFCVSLYEAVYGERPYEGSTFAALMLATQGGEVRPAPRGSKVPVALRKVLLRGLVADPAERWPSMADLLGELERLLTPRGWREVAGVGVVLAAIAGLVALQQSGVISEQEEQLTEKEAQLQQQVVELRQEKERVEQEKQRVSEQLSAQKGLRATMLAKEAGHGLEAVGLAVEAFGDLDAKGGTVSPAVFTGLTSALMGVQAGITLMGHTDRVVAVAYSPDGSLIATAAGRESSLDNSVRLWNARSGEPLRTFEGQAGQVYAVAFSPDGQRLATASKDKTARVWNASTCKEITSLLHEEPVLDVAFSPDGQRLATASGDTIRVWHMGSDSIVVPLLGHTDRVRAVAFSPDGTQLASASEDQTARVWDTHSGVPLRTLEGHTDKVYAVAFSPDGTHIATGSRDQTARSWDVATGKQVNSFPHDEVVYAAAFSPDGKQLATGTFDDDAAHLWSAITGSRLTDFRHEGPVVDVAFSPDGTQLATASWDGTARSWNVAPSGGITALKGHSSRVDAVAFSPDGARIATGSGDGTARVWARSGRPLAVLRGHRLDVLAVAFSPDGTRIATASWDGTVRLWDVDSGAWERTFEGHMGPVYTVAFSPNGARLLTASADGTARVWNASTGEELCSLAHEGPVVDATFAPKGERLLTVGADDTAHLWNVATGQPITTFPYEGPVTAVAFSANGKTIAAATKNYSVRSWDADSGAPGPTFKGHTAAVLVVVFSADGKRIATASEDRTARVWDASTGVELIAFPHERAVLDVAFSPDGTGIATASAEKVAQLWTLEPRPWFAWGCSVLDQRQAHTDTTRGVCSPTTPDATTMEFESSRSLAEPVVSTAEDVDAQEVIMVHGVELVLIPGGTFTMGSPEGVGADSERPQHEVTLDSFYLARTEVTHAQYALYLEANPMAKKPRSWEDERYNQPEQPVGGVSWHDAKAYCDWAGLVLPTEAQWEYAARAGTTTAYWFGDGDDLEDLERFGWYRSNSGDVLHSAERPHSVGTKGANAYGLYDVSGNAVEWVLDAYGSYTTSPRSGDGLRVEPVGDRSRVLRGSSFNNEARLARSGGRAEAQPSLAGVSAGFRPAKSHP
ncbi:SUMF1/EgtB/PvdO family nonheme iron enzyme [Paraliomyxa miuraensis]|uniref:SUMF1/EgtB/PvdO family nonheme iron enzyme n=1 Tax=Paraliomyxa miuraensis TaxID=376150 RepID=UPI00224F7B29|nr:SUMF1/EgtB/PvdO family nonheme iron enzyme [Paraliomyxa miuraensis]MCX4239428.1 SUMF1/EgtB/PvdO family nonheme iron enzyme [Paraliomyxa miuraensis]